MRGNMERGRLGKPPELRMTDLNRSPNDSTEDPYGTGIHTSLKCGKLQSQVMLKLGASKLNPMQTESDGYVDEYSEDGDYQGNYYDPKNLTI